MVEEDVDQIAVVGEQEEEEGEEEEGGEEETRVSLFSVSKLFLSHVLFSDCFQV